MSLFILIYIFIYLAAKVDSSSSVVSRVVTILKSVVVVEQQKVSVKLKAISQ